MFKKTIAMTGAAALLALGLTGCGATVGGGAQSEEAAASADNQLCVIPRTPTPQLLEAVSAGLKTAGYEVKVLPEDAKTDACDHCVLYGLMLNEKRDGVKAFVFQSFKNGQPELAANAPVENNQVNLQQVAQYAVEFAAALKKNAEAGGTCGRGACGGQACGSVIPLSGRTAASGRLAGLPDVCFG